MRHFLTIVLAYAASRILFALAGFHYELFRDSLHVGKLAIDFGVFVGFWYGFYWLLGLFKPFRTQDGG